MERIAIVNGIRSPIAKANGKLNHVSVDTLSAIVAKELVLKTGLDYAMFDEVIIGNVSQPVGSANVAKVIASLAGFPESTPAYTVHRNCASGMQSISSAIEKIYAKQGELYLVGGVESMSNIPVLFSNQFKDFLMNLNGARKPMDKLKVFSSFRFNFLKPTIGLIAGLTDPISGKIMGLTGENLANDFKITREQQDEYALQSHLKAQKAIEDGVLKDEIHPIMTKDGSISEDDGIRFNQTKEALGKLRPIFDRNGTVTAGNSSQVSDGAAFLIVCSESKAKALNLEPIAYITNYAYAGLDASRMGLGPVYATKKLFDKTGNTLDEMDLIELNEAFATQVLANIEAFKSKAFCKRVFNSEPLGEINPDILNIHGGAIALGHPVGMSGTRIVLHLAKQLRAQGLKKGLATLCVGGGQGASFLVEV